MKNITATWLTLALATSSFVAHAQKLTVYTWVDDQGITNFANTAPTQQVDTLRSFEMKVDPAPQSSGENANASEYLDALLAKQTPQNSLSDERKNYCEKARHNLDVLSTYQIVREVKKSGETRVLSEQEKKEYFASLNKQVVTFC